MSDVPATTPLPGTSLLALAQRWFPPSTVWSVFEPLIADWQREWQAAPRGSRPLVRIRGAAAFFYTSLALMPRIVVAPLPSALTSRVTRHVLLYCALSVVFQGLVTYVSWRAAAPPPSAWLYLVPALFTALLPFAMVAGADAIRCHEAWPDHVQRRAAFKLVVITTVWMVAGGGWIVPATNRQWQAAVDSANAGQAVAPLTRASGLSTTELLTVGDHDSRSTTLLFPGERRRELEQRVSFALLPILFLFVRWRLLDQGATGWFVPLPMSVIGAMAVSGVILLRALYGLSESSAPPWPQPVVILMMMLLFEAGRVHRRSGDQKVSTF